jgi:hypothetical protein
LIYSSVKFLQHNINIKANYAFLHKIYAKLFVWKKYSIIKA